MKKTITNEQYHHALALYMVARRKQTEVDQLEAEMNRILGDENGSHASEAIYDYEHKGTREEFDEAIHLMNIEVEKQEE